MSEILLVNPRRRRKGRKAKASRKRRHSFFKSNPRRRRGRRVRRSAYRSNPSLRGMMGSVMPTVKAGALGATGAVINSLLMGYTKSYLPASLQTGAVSTAVKVLYAVLTGVVGNVVLRGKGQALANGAMTVVLTDFAKSQLASFAPSLPLGDYTSYGPAVGYGPTMPAPNLSTSMGRVGKYMNGMGVYMAGVGDTEYANGIPTG